jgi:hypothetical protein
VDSAIGRTVLETILQTFIAAKPGNLQPRAAGNSVMPNGKTDLRSALADANCVFYETLQTLQINHLPGQHELSVLPGCKRRDKCRADKPDAFFTKSFITRGTSERHRGALS